jgi:predicted nucleotidyltransferase
MLTLDTLRLEKKSEIIRLAESRGCRNVRVFGSLARGDSDPQSDVDFLVDLDPGRTISDLGGLLMDLQDALGAPVDVVTERGLRVRVRESILAEAVVL